MFRTSLLILFLSSFFSLACGEAPAKHSNDGITNISDLDTSNGNELPLIVETTENPSTISPQKAETGFQRENFREAINSILPETQKGDHPPTENERPEKVQEKSLVTETLVGMGEKLVPGAKQNIATPDLERQQAVSHDIWDQLLQKHVSSSGEVNYAGFRNDKAKLETYLTTLEKTPPSASWSKAEKMAFWINTYNAFTVQLIVNNFPISSIMKLDGGKTWDVKRIKIGNQNLSLNDIEHTILRPQFKDARIHFAVNCAAKSCPPLYNRAVTAANLEASLHQLTKDFINNKQFNSITSSTLKVSKIFEWYASDFGNLIDFINRYSTVKAGKNAGISYQEYNWGLNN